MRWWFDTTTGAALVVGGLAIANNNNNNNNINSSGTWSGNMGCIPSPTMVTWLVDGNNLSCSRKVPNDREIILRELSKIASLRGSVSESTMMTISSVVVVFDGNDDEECDRTTIDQDKWLEWTVTDGRGRRKDRADDWIVDRAIPDLRQFIDTRVSNHEGTTKVNLVSADRDLQKRVLATRIMNGGSVVHPPKFWTDYLPVLQEQQRKQLQLQQREEGS